MKEEEYRSRGTSAPPRGSTLPGELQKYSDRTGSAAGPRAGGRAGHGATWWPSRVPGFTDTVLSAVVCKLRLLSVLSTRRRRGEGGEEEGREEGREE